MTRLDPTLTCPSCGHEHPPHLKYCIKCGAKLPEPIQAVDRSAVEPSGRARGIEPDAEGRYAEPVYTDGRAASSEATSETPAEIPPAYAGVDNEKQEAEAKADKPKAPPPPPNAALVVALVLASIAVPPLGIVVTVIWLIMPTYRKSALSTFIAALIGGGLWGWAMWLDMRGRIYDEPYEILQQYIAAQDWARETDGHYLPMLELRIQGYLPADFPPDSSVEFTIVEHVLGPTGYLVEIRPGAEERRLYGMRSLWADHTGDVRTGSIDGPRYSP